MSTYCIFSSLKLQSHWIQMNLTNDSGMLWQCSGNILTLMKMCKVVIQYFSAWFVSTNRTKHKKCFWMVQHQTLCAQSKSICWPHIDWYTLFGYVIAVRFWRITTHRLYTTLHNLIIVDFPHCLVPNSLLLLIHLFGPFLCCSATFLTIASKASKLAMLDGAVYIKCWMLDGTLVAMYLRKEVRLKSAGWQTRVQGFQLNDKWEDECIDQALIKHSLNKNYVEVLWHMLGYNLIGKPSETCSITYKIHHHLKCKLWMCLQRFWHQLTEQGR